MGAGGHASVNHDGLASNKGGFIAGQPQGNVDDFLGLAQQYSRGMDEVLLGGVANSGSVFRRGETVVRLARCFRRRRISAGTYRSFGKCHIVPMIGLAWRMGQLLRDYNGLSLLGAEAVTATESLNSRLLVSALDDGPGIRNACVALRIPYKALKR